MSWAPFIILQLLLNAMLIPFIRKRYFYIRASPCHKISKKLVIFLLSKVLKLYFFFFFYRSEAQFSTQCRQRHPNTSCVISWHVLRYSVCFSLLLSALTATIMNDILGPQCVKYCCIKIPIIWFLGGRNLRRTQCLTLATVLWRCGHRVVMKR